ncbi:MAG: 5-formyltetrahydrofolate cyclo-ligase [Cytophagaceae bacterium]
MLKADIRKLFLEKRSYLSLYEAEDNSLKLSELFFRHFSQRVKGYVHVFLPIEEKAEINTAHIINKIFSEFPHVKLVVPKADFASSTMESLLFTKDTDLSKNKWGIPEPVNAVNVNELNIDMVLLPMLAFDLQGNRVGYGKGFYDRFLSNCRRDVLKVGLCFFEPIEIIEDLNPFDVKMDWCVTPEKVYKF